MPTKVCPVCKRTLMAERFARDKSRKDGLYVRCKACDCDRSRRYYAANRASKLAKTAARNEAVREASGPRKCMECGASATSQHHWFCDSCRANGARRSRPGATKRKPLPPAQHCERGTPGCAMRHSLEGGPCCESLSTRQMFELFNEPQALDNFARHRRAPYYPRLGEERFTFTPYPQ